MKLIIVAFALVAVAVAVPIPEEAKILRFQSEQEPDGSYNFNFETEDGIIRYEKGEPKIVNDEENKPQTIVSVRGSYTYPGEDGKPVLVEYIADENGFHAEGETIPKNDNRR